jgi:hypothetical protein
VRRQPQRGSIDLEPSSRADSLRSLLLFLGVVALLVLPGAPDSPFGGTPLSGVGRGCLAMYVVAGAWMLLFRSVRPVPLWAVLALACACALKLGFGTVGIPSGWRAEYDMLDGPVKRATFFWRFDQHRYRIEPSIDVEGNRPGMHFLNDLRYASGAFLAEARQVTVPLRVAWTGHLRAGRPSLLAAIVSARGTVRVRLDGHEVWSASDPDGQLVELTLAEGGPHVLAVVYEKPAKVNPLMTFRWQGTSPRVSPDASSARSSWIQRSAGALTTALCSAGAIVFIVAAVTPRIRPLAPRRSGSRLAALTALAVSGFLVGQALRTNQPLIDRTYFMSTGNDPIAYEGAARDIMEFGLLMNGGRSLGEGNPYGYYPLYSYVLAAVHWLIGDDAAAAFLANGMFLASTVWFTWMLGWCALRGMAAVVAVTGLGMFLWWYAFPYTGETFSDNLFLPMVFAALVSVSVAVRTGTTGAATSAGVLCALTAAARPSFLLFLPILAACLMMWDRHRRPRALRLIVLLFVGFVVGVAPFTLRNYLVSGQFVMLMGAPGSGIPHFLVPSSAELSGRLTGAPSFSEILTVSAEIFVTHPWRSFTIEARKVLFTLGFTNLSPYEQALRPSFVVVTAMGFMALARGRVPSSVALVGVAFALSHGLSMILAAPWTYGYKTILPNLTLSLFWSMYLLHSRATATRDVSVPAAPTTEHLDIHPSPETADR